MSKKAWTVLIGMIILSILVAGVSAWAVKHPPHPLPGLPIVGPAYGIPIRPQRPQIPSPSTSTPHTPQRKPSPAPQLRPFLPWRMNPMFTRPRPLWRVTRVLASEIFLFLVATLTFLLFPRRLFRSRKVFQRPRGAWMAFTTGLMGSAVMTLLSILAIFSAFGLIILPWLLLLFAFVWIMGVIVAAFQLGAFIREVAHIPDDVWMLDLALGIVMLVILGALPIVGWIFFLLLGIGGMGAVILTRFGSTTGWEVNIAPEESPH